MSLMPANQAAVQAAWDQHTERVRAYYARVVEPAQQLRRPGDFITGYVRQMPPRFEGERPKSLAVQRPDIPTKPFFIAAAQRAYRFTPLEVDENNFKHRFAAEAVRAGLTQEEVVGVYAFETGGSGKYDMQPIGRSGHPISSATGYGQLLNTNSIILMQKYGAFFAARLEQQARHSPQEAQRLLHTAHVLRAMHRDAQGIGQQYQAATGRPPDNWNEHEWFAKHDPAGRGRAMHAMLYDAHAGPMMQAVKLAGIKQEWNRAFRGQRPPSPAEIEMLNLLGERPGLLITQNMRQVGDYPITNFIDVKGYLANPIVQDKTAAQLLHRIGTKMQEHRGERGSQALAQAFDNLSRSMPAYGQQPPPRSHLVS